MPTFTFDHLFLLAVAAAVSSASLSCAFQSAAPVVGYAQARHRQQRSLQLPRLHDSTNNIEQSSSSASPRIQLSPAVDFQSLMVMDVVLFRRRTNNDATKPKLEMGAVQENGNVAPLSTWTLESAYTSATNDMMEFVVDEEDLFPGLTSEEIDVLKVFDGNVMSYGSRQVGGGKGPGNPHGEESELLYYLDRGVVEGTYHGDEKEGDSTESLTIDVVVNPNLEHLW